jgi:hypothetical protein
LTSLLAQLTTQIGRFDEAALEALGNRGLLRRARKDLEREAPRLLAQSDSSVSVQTGEQTVVFDKRGPAHAHCTCGAMTTCHHVLAAALGLVQIASTFQSPQPLSGAAQHAASDADANTTDLQDDLLALADAALIAHAGKAGYRWAWQFVQDLDPEQALEIRVTSNVALSFRQPRITFRYMGGGIDGLIADAELSKLEKYRVAAVLAFKRAHGVEIAAPETHSKARAGNLGLGHDHSAKEYPAEHLADSRNRLHQSLELAFSESIELGLTHLSDGIRERFETLSVWAHGVEYFRLAMSLRRIADHVELILQRAGGADEHRLFDEITVASGLTEALKSPHSAAAGGTRLAGVARTRYERGGTVELFGLGAYTWRTASGYVGLTSVYWSPSEKAFLTCSDARPESLRGFSPIERYHAPGPWTGLESPAASIGRRVFLKNAQVNSQGRISGSESATAVVQPFSATDFQLQGPPVVSDWQGMMREMSESRRSLLDEPRASSEFRVLKPAEYGVARFDEPSQRLVWPLLDEAGTQIDAEVEFGTFTNHIIGRIESMRRDELPSGSLLLVQLRRAARGILIEPVSLIRNKPAASDNAIDVLYFDAGKSQGFVSKWLTKLTVVPAASSQLTMSKAFVIPNALREMRFWLERHIERGVSEGESGRLQREFDGWAERCGNAGLTAFRKLRVSGIRPAQLLLRSNFIYLQYTRMLGSVSDEK